MTDRQLQIQKMVRPLWLGQQTVWRHLSQLPPLVLEPQCLKPRGQQQVLRCCWPVRLQLLQPGRAVQALHLRL